MPLSKNLHHLYGEGLNDLTPKKCSIWYLTQNAQKLFIITVNIQKAFLLLCLRHFACILQSFGIYIQS